MALPGAKALGGCYQGSCENIEANCSLLVHGNDCKGRVGEESRTVVPAINVGGLDSDTLRRFADLLKAARATVTASAKRHVLEVAVMSVSRCGTANAIVSAYSPDCIDFLTVGVIVGLSYATQLKVVLNSRMIRSIQMPSLAG